MGEVAAAGDVGGEGVGVEVVGVELEWREGEGGEWLEC